MSLGIGGSRKRPYDTVAPLAADLGLEIDISCGKEDDDCVSDVVDDYDGEGNILIWLASSLHARPHSHPLCNLQRRKKKEEEREREGSMLTRCKKTTIINSWAHKQLNNIAEALGAKDVKNYPDDAFNLIWVDPPPYKHITDVLNENCPGLD